MKPTAANIKQKYGSERRFDMLEINDVMRGKSDN